MYRTMCNVAMEQFNQQKRDRRCEQEIELDRLPSSQLPPPDVVVARLSEPEILRIVGEVLARAPEDHRIIFMLARVGMKREEIAKELGIAPGTVRSRLSRLTEKIKNELARAALTDSGLQGGSK
jgi:RNA polymerase sigma factor (sigma-70 family)